jgi:TonB-dependent SusC/RagA subfamily outer membrane receptor
LLSGFALESAAQEFSLKGVVADARTGERIAGARITLLRGEDANRKENLGKVANAKGEFEFANLQAGAYRLRITAPLYKPLEKTETVGEVFSSLEMEATRYALQPDVRGLEEVVVTGVASRTQKSVAEIAVARVDAAALTETNTFQDLTQVLTGKVAGVNVAPASGNVGGGVRFVVRSGGGLYGSGQPVIFIDGARIDNSEIGFFAGGQRASTLADLNPEDIQSVEVLKGPAASALYGTSGSNGVILIKTKSGARKAPLNTFTVEAKVIAGKNEPSALFTENQALSYNEANALLRTGDIRQYNVGISGNAGFAQYFASFDRREEEGVIAQNGMARTSARVKVEAFPSERLSLTLSANFTDNLIKIPQNDDNVYGLLNNTLGFRPENVYSNAFGSIRFAGAQAALEAVENSVSTQRFIGSAELLYKPISGLALRASVGYDAANNQMQRVFPRIYPFIRIINGQRELETRRVEQFTIDASASYSATIGENIQSTTILGAQLFGRKARGFDLAAQDFATELMEDVETAQTLISANETLTEDREAGVFFQQEFSYNDAYFLSFGVRNDYASSVGAAAPQIFYPRASAAVRLDKLGILPEAVNLAKVRVAFGQSGQLPPSLASAERFWGSVQSGYGVGAVVQRIGNPALEPERIGEVEFGAEMEFENAYGFDMTYFLQQADNSIVDFFNSPSSGLTATSFPRNVGRIRGWGLESSLYATPVRSNDTELRIQAIVNYADNVVEDIGGAPPLFAGVGRNVITPGLRRSAFYLVRVLEPRYLASGAYNYAQGPVLDTARSYAGTPVPIVTGSLGVTFRFLRYFTLSALAETALGHSLYNNTRMLSTNPARGNNPEFNRLATALGLPGNAAQPASIRSLPPAPGVQALQPGTQEYREAAEAFARLDHRHFFNGVEPADWIRLREVSLSCNATEFARALFGDGAVKNIVVAFSARNLALWTRYSGADVEVSRDGSRSISRGLDNYTLQQPRVFNLALTVGL